MEKFIGPKKVESLEKLEYTSFSGGEVYKVEYAGGDTEVMTQKTFDIVATDETSDYTTVRAKQFDALKKEFFPLLADYISKMGDEEGRKEARTAFLQESLILIAEYSIKQRDIDVVFEDMAASITADTFKAIGESIDENYNRATNFLWTGDDRKFIPGVHPMGAITFLEAKGFLEKINDSKNK